MIRCLLLLTAMMLSFAAPAQQLKIATLAPDGSSWMDRFRAAAERIESQTDKRVRIRFYPGGVMGDANAVLRRMRLGQLHGGAFTVGELGSVAPEVNLYSLPFTFETAAEIDALRPRFDPLILDALAEGGIIAPGIALGGFAYLFSREAFPDPEDLSTQWRVWVPTGDALSLETLEATGVSPVPLPLADVYTSLQTGAVNAFASTPSAAIILQWHTRARHMLDLPILMTAGTVGLAERAMRRLSDEDRRVVVEELGEALEALEAANVRENAQARDALVNQGIAIESASREQTEAWREIADRTRARMTAAGQIEVPHLAELESELERLRADP
jgi:TRAP-type C4-dicarboxylate transport system substrate-binding protein